MRTISRALVPCLVLAAVLAAVEWVVRATLPHVRPLEALVQEPRLLQELLGRATHRDLPERVQIFDADPLLFWRLKPNLRDVIWASTLVSTNSERLRYPRELAPRSPRRFRVVCLGDSVTFGYQIPRLARDEPIRRDARALSYTEVLERDLSDALPERDVEVVPMAVPGYSSYQGRAWLQRDIAVVQPDVVIVAFGWNDADLRGAPDVVTMPQGWHHVASRRVVLSSQALIRAAGLMRRVGRGGRTGGGVARVSAEEFVDNHRAITETARARGAAVLFIAPIYRDAVTDPTAAERIASYRRALERFARAADIPFVAVGALSETGAPHNEPLFYEEVHPNASGHQLLADAVFDTLWNTVLADAGGGDAR